MHYIFRRKPFAILAFVVSIVLLVLAIVTKAKARCSLESQLNNSEIIEDNCHAVCDNPQFPYRTFTYTAYHEDYDRKFYAMCGWHPNIGNVFFASACLMVVITMGELVTAKLYHVTFNIGLFVAIVLGIISCVQQRHDIYRFPCEDIDKLAASDQNLPQDEIENGKCSKSIFSACLGLQIFNLILFCAQMIYNYVKRGKWAHKEEESKETNIKNVVRKYLSSLPISQKDLPTKP